MVLCPSLVCCGTFDDPLPSTVDFLDHRKSCELRCLSGCLLFFIFWKKIPHWGGAGVFGAGPRQMEPHPKQRGFCQPAEHRQVSSPGCASCICIFIIISIYKLCKHNLYFLHTLSLCTGKVIVN